MISPTSRAPPSTTTPAQPRFFSATHMSPPMAALIEWPFIRDHDRDTFRGGSIDLEWRQTLDTACLAVTVTPEKQTAAPANFIWGASARIADESD
jgi:hypothetical protein